MSTYEERQAYRDSHPGVIVDANSVYNPSTGQQSQFPSSGSNSAPPPQQQSAPAAQQGNGDVAADGQTLASQDAATQAMFSATFGANAAAQWAAQHNAAIGAPPPTQTTSTTTTPPGTTTNPSAPGPVSLDPASLAALTQFGSQASGVTQAQLAESKRQFDLNLAWQKQMWENQGLPQLVINQRAQALTEQKYQSDLELARQAMALQQAGVTGMFNGEPTLAAQQQTFGQHMSLANQGLSYLQAASALQGPQNVFQQSEFFRGAQGNSDVPMFLRALQQNSRLPAFTAQGTPATPLSMGTLTGGLTGQGANPGFNANSSLAAIKQLSDRGPASIAPGGLERLSPDELAALGSGLGAVGNSLPAFLTQYQNSRPQQSAMSGDMSLAA